MKSWFSTKKRIAAVALSGAIILGGAGIAAAIFTTGNTATGQGSVGTGSIWNVSISTPTGSPLLPGVGSQTMKYTIKNTTNTTQTLHSVSAVLGDSGGFITQGGVAVTGCLSTWFFLNPNVPALPQDVPPHGIVTDNLTLSMPASSVDQDACESTTPDISVSVS
jgi:hypothetical protein